MTVLLAKSGTKKISDASSKQALLGVSLTGFFCKLHLKSGWILPELGNFCAKMDGQIKCLKVKSKINT